MHRHGAFRPLEGGVPSPLHEAPGTVFRAVTFSRLSKGLDPEGLRQALVFFAANRAGRLGPDVAWVDGKTPRRSFEGASRHSPLHVANAFVVGARLAPGQVRADGRPNGIAAMPALPERPDVKGMTTAADAMHAQLDTAARVAEAGGVCVLAPRTAGRGFTKMSGAAWRVRGTRRRRRGSGPGTGSHGRVEAREAVVCRDVGPLQDLHGRPGLKAVGKVSRRGRPGEAERGASLPPSWRGARPEAIPAGRARMPGGGEPAPLGAGRDHGGGRPPQPEGQRPREPGGHAQADAEPCTAGPRRKGGVHARKAGRPG